MSGTTNESKRAIRFDHPFTRVRERIMLSALFSRWLKKGRKVASVRRASYRPELLVFEERITPAVVYWAGNGAGDGAS